MNAVMTAAMESIELKALRGAARLAPRWFEKRLFACAAEAAKAITFTPGREFVYHMLRAGPAILAKANPQCRAKAIDNFLVSAVRGKRERMQYHRRTGFQPPYLLVISPTMRCNLRCTGCYAMKYGKGEDMPADLLDRILREARGMGMYFMTISGGEPFARPDILDILARHPEIYFQVYTNGNRSRPLGRSGSR